VGVGYVTTINDLVITRKSIKIRSEVDHG
jgi:hypothetical protein